MAGYFVYALSSLWLIMSVLSLLACLFWRKKRSEEDDTSTDDNIDHFDRIDSMSFSGRYPSCYLTSEFDEISSLRISVMEVT